MIRSRYKDLEVWHESMDLAVECCEIANTFPKYELYGLGSQLRRASASVPCNIAEGHGRRNAKEFINHLHIAYGSLAELETQIQIAFRLEYISEETSASLLDRADKVGRMINGLLRSLEKKEKNPNQEVAAAPRANSQKPTPNSR